MNAAMSRAPGRLPPMDSLIMSLPSLAVHTLGLPQTLRGTFAPMPAIENVIGAVRNVTRNVTRWRGAALRRRWVDLGVASPEQGLRGIKGHRDLTALVRALVAYTADSNQEAAYPS